MGCSCLSPCADDLTLILIYLRQFSKGIRTKYIIINQNLIRLPCCPMIIYLFLYLQKLSHTTIRFYLSISAYFYQSELNIRLSIESFDFDLPGCRPFARSNLPTLLLSYFIMFIWHVATFFMLIRYFSNSCINFFFNSSYYLQFFSLNVYIYLKYFRCWHADYICIRFIYYFDQYSCLYNFQKP